MSRIRLFRPATRVVFLISFSVVVAMFYFGARANASVKRSCSFAGSWYEGNREKLKSQIDEMIGRAASGLDQHPVDRSFDPNPLPEQPILAIIVPHAGYMFSGATAAYAYKLASDHAVKRVFLLGPSHYVGFEGAVLPSESVFATPLGDLEVDAEVVDELADYPMFRVSSEIHRREHSLELQLPFIRETLGAVKIVPIIIGNLSDPSDIALVGQMLKRYVREGDLVVVSSDFTHFGPRYQYQPFQDHIRENVRKLDSEAFHHLSALDLDGFVSFRNRTHDTICGFVPCAVLISMLPHEARGSLLNYRTSQDTIAEDDRNSVSYLAIAFSSKAGSGWQTSFDPATEQLSDTDQEHLLKAARMTLETFVKEGKMPDKEMLKPFESSVLKRPMGAFVTLYKRPKEKLHNLSPSDERHHKELRGCIGYIWPVKPLLQTVVENTVGACSRDPRFKPVAEDEVANLQISINVLSQPRKINSYENIDIGRDGVILYKQGKQAVFLPSVAREFGWGLEELLTQLSLKAGLSADGWKSGARFEVFQAETISEPLQ